MGENFGVNMNEEEESALQESYYVGEEIQNMDVTEEADGLMAATDKEAEALSATYEAAFLEPNATQAMIESTAGNVVNFKLNEDGADEVKNLIGDVDAMERWLKFHYAGKQKGLQPLSKAWADKIKGSGETANDAVAKAFEFEGNTTYAGNALTFYAWCLVAFCDGAAHATKPWAAPHGWEEVAKGQLFTSEKVNKFIKEFLVPRGTLRAPSHSSTSTGAATADAAGRFGLMSINTLQTWVSRLQQVSDNTRIEVAKRTEGVVSPKLKDDLEYGHLCAAAAASASVTRCTSVIIIRRAISEWGRHP
jgi:hypothetical protein